MDEVPDDLRRLVNRRKRLGRKCLLGTVIMALLTGFLAAKESPMCIPTFIMGMLFMMLFVKLLSKSLYVSRDDELRSYVL